ncbi:MAG: HlyD family type I secretion periplasmic adaptor subunit [Kiloniellales bacterium]
MKVVTTTDSPTQLRVDMMRGPRLAVVLLLLLLVGLVAVAIYWSSHAELDEVTSGLGQVIPSREVQVIQNLEGGIVSEILVKEEQEVEAGQILVRIDDTAAGARFRESQETYLGVMATVARLTAEARGESLEFPEKLHRDRPDLVARETQLYDTRRAEFDQSLAILRQQRAQRIKELEELESNLRSLRKSYKLSKEEYDITAPMVDKGLVSKVELLRLGRDVADIESQIEATKIAIPRARSAIAEAGQRINVRMSNFRAEALRQGNELKVRLAALQEGLTARKDRVARTEVVSPVRGIVKQLNVNTIGGVVQPGQNIVEIVPIDDTLLVEAKIKPSDVAFVHPGQKAVVKLTAYDFSIYGGLDASLEQISADTITDEQGNSFYRIRVRTDEPELKDRDGDRLPIIPGMVASVDIITGKKTVLEYLVKPFVKARHRAMRER